MAHDVFISHSAKDKQVADQVCAALEVEAVKCWIAPRDILPGKIWAEAIIDGIDNSRVMIAVISSNANASGQIKREIERADAHGVTLVPFFIEKVTPSKYLEYYIGNTHWFDASAPPLDEHLHKLVQTVKTLLEKPESAPPIKDASAPPDEARKNEDAARDKDSLTVGIAKTVVPSKNYDDPVPTPRPTNPLRWVMVGVAALVLAGITIWAVGKWNSSKPDNQNNQTVKPAPTSTPDPTQGMKGEPLAAFRWREGFQSLVDGDYDRAVKAFDAADKAVPQYLSAYDIARLLKNSNLNDPDKRREVFRTIITKYPYKAPPDLIAQLKTLAGATDSAPTQNNQPQPSATQARPTLQPDRTRPVAREPLRRARNN